MQTAQPPMLPTMVFPAAQVTGRKRTAVKFVPDAAAREAIAAELGLLDLPAFTMEAEFTPEGRGDLRLQGRIKARVVQPCVVTLVPVATDLDEKVLRRYLTDFAEPDAEETEIPEDDSLEPLPQFIDAAAVAVEVLALALPQYPRATGAELGSLQAAPKGAAPLAETDLKPLAGLGALLASKTGGADKV